MFQPMITRSVNRRANWLDAAAVCLFVVVLAGLTWRLNQNLLVAGEPSRERWGLADFRDVTYYPAIAAREGVNPYDAAIGDSESYLWRYPVGNYFPLYSPLLLLLAQPFTALPLGAAMWVYWAFNVLLLIAFAWMALRITGWNTTIAAVLTLAAILLASQPGRANFNAGQVALPLAIATAVSLAYGDRRPGLTALCVAFATFKPTYGIPLGCLLICRRDWKSGLMGLAAGGLIAAIGLAVVFGRAGDLTPERAFTILAGNQQSFAEHPDVNIIHNKARIDLPAAVEYLLGQPLPGWANLVIAIGVLVAAGSALLRLRAGNRQAGGVSAAIALLALLLCMFHNIYDALLLAIPLLGATSASDASWKILPAYVRWIVVGLLALPLINVLWTDTFASSVAAFAPAAFSASDSLSVRFASALNGIALASACATLVVAVHFTKPVVEPSQITSERCLKLRVSAI